MDRSVLSPSTTLPFPASGPHSHRSLHSMLICISLSRKRIYFYLKKIYTYISMWWGRSLFWPYHQPMRVQIWSHVAVDVHVVGPRTSFWFQGVVWWTLSWWGCFVWRACSPSCRTRGAHLLNTHQPGVVMVGRKSGKEPRALGREDTLQVPFFFFFGERHVASSWVVVTCKH